MEARKRSKKLLKKIVVYYEKSTEMRQSVLNREQQKILELLKEIDTICRKNKITYFLSPYFTLCAVTGTTFSAESHSR